MTYGVLPLILIFYLLFQGNNGQNAGILGNSQTGQNNIPQAFGTNSAVKSSLEILPQNGSNGNLQISFTPQRQNSQQTSTMQNFQTLSQQQNMQQLFNQQAQLNKPTMQLQLLPQASLSPPSCEKQSLAQQSPKIQQKLLPQSSSSSQSYVQQSTVQQSPTMQQQILPPSSLTPQTHVYQSTVQQPINYQQGLNGFVPYNSQQVPYFQTANPQQSLLMQNYNLQQQLPIGSSFTQQVQTPGYPITNSVMSSNYHTSATPNVYRHPEYINNLGGNYLMPNIASSFIETSQPASYPNTPFTSSYTVPHSTSFANSGITYQNQGLGAVKNTLVNQNAAKFKEPLAGLENDNLASLLLSLMDTPSKPKNQIYSTYPENPYAQSYANQGSKSFSMKSLLPFIINLLKEKKDGCNRRTCNCDCKNNNDIGPQINDSYSNKRDYGNLKEEMFRDNNSEEETTRIAREQKKHKKMKNSIPDVSKESFEKEESHSEEFSREDNEKTMN